MTKLCEYCGNANLIEYEKCAVCLNKKDEQVQRLERLERITARTSENVARLMGRASNE